MMKKIKYSFTAFILTLILSLATAQEDRYGVPGIPVDHSPASTRQYLGSPSILILKNGDYLVSHDFFGPGSTMNKTFIFRSKDRGKTWNKISEVNGAFWSSLFIHKDTIYLFGVSRNYGDIVIRRSSDEGVTWTNPDSPANGLIRGGGEYHCAPMPVIIYKGRIWRAFEKRDPPKGWAENHLSFMLSASVNDNLMDARSWTSSDMLRGDEAYGAWLEGNAVVSPAGELLNILRTNNKVEESAAIIHVSENGRQLSFNPEKDLVRFPGGCKKFVIRFDEKSNRYWSLSNWVPEKFRGKNVERTRNTLALISSPDLKDWTVHTVLLQDDNTEKSGFQYADWLVENDDIIFVSRTAFFDGTDFADNQHNSNFITFHRIAGFRKLADSVIEIIKNNEYR